MPLPNHRVIPVGWSAHHRPVADGRMTAECTITRPASAATVAPFDEAAGVSVPATPVLIYSGVCYVQRSGANERQTDTAGRETTIRHYEVGIPIAGPAPIQDNDHVNITACGDDPQMVGQRLRVRDVQIGSLAWQRSLRCEHVEPTTR